MRGHSTALWIKGDTVKVFIVVDMEGATGVVHRDQLMPEGRGYSAAQQLLTGDVNAAIEGVLSVYPNAECVVGDGHGSMRNILLEQLHPSATLVVGGGHPTNKPLLQCEGIDASFNAAICVGFHSKAGTPNGVLSHTYVGSTIAAMHMNGREVGEVEVDAAILGSFGVPLLCVTGNSDLEPEIREWNQECGFVATKQSLGATAAICKPPSRTSQEITEAVAQSIQRHQHQAMTPYLHGKQVELTVEFYRREMVERALRIQGVVAKGDRSIVVQGVNGAEAFRVCWLAVAQTLHEPQAWLQ